MRGVEPAVPVRHRGTLFAEWRRTPWGRRRRCRSRSTRAPLFTFDSVDRDGGRVPRSDRPADSIPAASTLDRPFVRAEDGGAGAGRGGARLRQRDGGDSLLRPLLGLLQTGDRNGLRAARLPRCLPADDRADECGWGSRSRSFDGPRPGGGVRTALEGARLLYLESPTSIVFEVQDIGVLAACGARGRRGLGDRQFLGHAGVPAAGRTRRRPGRPLRRRNMSAAIPTRWRAWSRGGGT